MTMVYNVPLELAEQFSDHAVFLRTHDVSHLAQVLTTIPLKGLAGTELALVGDLFPDLSVIDPSIPVDLRILNTKAHELLLRDHSERFTHRIVRVVIPAGSGMVRSVKTAAGLGLPIKLRIGQPDGTVVEEMYEVLDYYLHDKEVSQPIEFFHSLLWTFFRDEEKTMWQIQEEDPSCNLYVTSDGVVTVSGRIPLQRQLASLASFLDELRLELLVAQGECSMCQFFSNCVGYFKFPDPDYSCDGIVRLMESLKNAAMELREDSERYTEIAPDMR